MHKLVRTLFFRLHILDPAAEEARLENTDDPTDGEIKMSVSKGALPEPEPIDKPMVADTGVAESTEASPAEDGAQSLVQAELSQVPLASTARPQCKNHLCRAPPRVSC